MLHSTTPLLKVARDVLERSRDLSTSIPLLFLLGLALCTGPKLSAVGKILAFYFVDSSLFIDESSGFQVSFQSASQVYLPVVGLRASYPENVICYLELISSFVP